MSDWGNYFSGFLFLKWNWVKLIQALLQELSEGWGPDSLGAELRLP